jgi:hypothetical protein
MAYIIKDELVEMTVVRVRGLPSMDVGFSSEFGHDGPGERNRFDGLGSEGFDVGK